MVYHLRSLVFNYRIGLKVDVPDQSLSLPSLTGVWRAADWLEREAYDLFGMRFPGHPDLRRIMMPTTGRGTPTAATTRSRGGPRGEREPSRA